MARFGGYETVGEVFRSGLATVWTARLADAPADALAEYLVKEFRPLDSMPGEEAAAEVELFLESADAQRRVAEAGAEHWATIHECGRCSSGAYYVSRYYQRSLHQLVASRVRFSAVALGTILDAIVQGLRELRQACDRPHGDLKPSNVLVETAGDITRTHVVLADPLATSQLPRTAGEEADVRAVGHILYRLVVHKLFQRLGGWPIAKGEDWRRLGRSGEAWRQLCERILDPEAGADTLTLEWLGDQIARIRRGKAAAKRLALAAVAVVVLGVGGWLVHSWATRPPKPDIPPFDLQRWQSLCTGFYNWFGPLHGSLDASRREAWRDDPTLARLVSKIEAAEQARVALDPRDVVDDRMAVPSGMAEKPPPAAQSPQGVQRTVAALKIIDDVRSTLGRDQWPKLESTAALAAAWRQHRWHRPASYLQGLVDAIDPREPDGSPHMPAPRIARDVDRVLALHDELLPAIEASERKIDQAQKALDQAGDKILGKLASYWHRQAVSEPATGSEDDVRKLQAGLAELSGVAAGLAAFVQGDWRARVDRELFLRDSAVHRSFDGTITKHTIRLWRDQVQGYYRLAPDDDPRSAEDWDRRTTQIATHIGTLERASAQGRQLAAGYGKRLDDEVRPAVAALRKLPAVVKTRADLQRKAADVKAKLDALGEEVERATIVYMGNPRDWLEGILRFEFKSSKVVNEEWKLRRGQLLVNITAEELEAKIEKYGALRRQVDALQGGLAELEGDSGLPRGMPERAAVHGARSWYSAFVARLGARRERTLETALGTVPREGAAPKLDDPGFAERWAQMTADYRSWRAAAADALVAFGAAAAALDAAYLLDETPPGLDQPLGRHLAAWTAKPIATEPALAKALEPIARRAAALRNVAQEDDRKALAAAALRTSQCEVALAAWRRLGTLERPPWPATDAELKQDGEIRALLTSELQVIPDAARRTTLRDAIAAESTRRMDRWLAQQNRRLRDHVEKAQATLEGTGDKVLAGFGAYAAAALAKATAQGRKAEFDKLTELKARADRLVAFVEAEWANNIDQAKFAADSRVHAAFDGTVTRDTLAAWLAEVVHYRKATAKEVITAVKAISSIGDSRALDAEWVKRRDLMLLIYPLSLLEADVKLLATVRVKFGVLQEFLRGLDDARALPAGLAPEAREQFPEQARAAVVGLLARRREQALAALAAKIAWGADGFPALTLAQFKQAGDWTSITGRYVQFRADLVTRMAAARRLPGWLDAGYLPDDEPKGVTATVAALHAEWQGFRKAVPELRGAIPGLDERMAALAALGRLSRDQLVARARSLSGDEAPQVPMAVWRRLGSVGDWPASLDELAVEAALRRRLASLAQRLGARDPHPVRWVAPALAKEGPRRWEACFNRLVPKGEPSEADDAKLAKAVELGAELELDTRRLSPATQLRLHLLALRRQLFALPDKADKKAAGALIAAFQRQAAALPDVGQRPDVLQFFGQALDILEKDEGQAPGSGLGRSGPAVYPHGGGWKAQPSPDGKAVTYTWAKGHSLHFALVDPTGGQGRPTYLCAAEVSLGLFIDVVAAANQWHQAIRLLKEYDLIADPRKGPRAWELTRDRKAIQPSKAWLVPLPGVRQPYPAGLTAGRAGREHPMQYVSPEAALFVARLLGSRLPTAAEWRAAAAGAKGQPVNLRDATWKRQQAHVASLWARGGRADWPDAGIFVPEATDCGFEREASVVSNADDGVLWFAPVAAGSGFRHLVGNVAEFVFESPAAFEAAFQDPAGLSGDAVAAFLDKHGQTLAIIGASALSPPELWNGRERAFGQAYPVMLDEVRDGLSDVGFRLAFTAPTESPVAALKRLVRQQGYMIRSR